MVLKFSFKKISNCPPCASLSFLSCLSCRLRHGRSDSSSCSSSPSRSISRSPTRRYRLTYSRSQGGRSRSKSWSRSRSRSASPIRHHRQWRDVYRSVADAVSQVDVWKDTQMQKVKLAYIYTSHLSLGITDKKCNLSLPLFLSSSFRSRRRESNSLRREQETRIQKLKAIVGDTIFMITFLLL